MVKPPKNMEPGAVDLAKAGRADNKSFEQDSFRNYMAKKIDLQRKQFGLALPPPPLSPELPPPPPMDSPKQVKLAATVNETKACPTATTTSTKRKRRSKGPGMSSLLKKLKRRHGSGHVKMSSSKKRARERDHMDSQRGTSSSRQSETPPRKQEASQEATQSSIHNIIAQQKTPPCQNSTTKEEPPLGRDWSEEEDEEETILTKKTSLAAQQLQKTAQLARERPDLFFLGVVVMVNGYTDPDTETIQRYLHKYGGDLEKYETSRITHIIAEQLSTAKANIYKRMRKPIPVVRPDWIVDCVQARKLLAHGDYLIQEVKDAQVKGMKTYFQTVPKAPVSTTTTAATIIRTNTNQAGMMGQVQASSSRKEPLAKGTHANQAKKSAEIVVERQPYFSKEPRQPPSHVDQKGQPPPPPPQQHEEQLTKVNTSTITKTTSSKANREGRNAEVKRKVQPSSSKEPQQSPSSVDEHDQSGLSYLAELLMEGNSSDDPDRPPTPPTEPQPSSSEPQQSPSHVDEEDQPPEPQQLELLMEENIFDRPPTGQQVPRTEPKLRLNVEKNQAPDLLLATADKAVAAPMPAIQKSPVVTGGKTDNKFINGKIRTVGTDPNFLESFFSNSRLSFIGSYKQRIQESPNKNNTTTLAEAARSDGPKQRFVMHADMDCFFAAVVLRNYPQYQNKPVAISHCGKTTTPREEHHHPTGAPPKKKSSSECATCNYEARKFGVKKGMFLGQAKQLCPNLIVLPYDFEGYEQVSEQVAIILQRYAAEYEGQVEQVSCDESYLELFVPSGGGKKGRSEDPLYLVGEIAENIRREIWQTTRCTATIGVGANKFLSKLATDRVKPNRSFVVRNQTELLRNLRLKDLHGIGYRTEPKLREEGLVSVQDVWDLGEHGDQELCRILGPGLGKKVWGFCKGQDDRPVKEAERKSIGAEV